MKIALKFLAGFAALLLLLIASIALLLMTVVNSDWLKTQISDYAKASTGRDLIIKGSLHASFWPRLGIRVDDVRLSNPPGFGDESFFSAHHLIIVAEILPLLHHELSVKRSTLSDAVINLQKNRQGQNNWTFVAQHAVEQKAPTSAENTPAESNANSHNVQFNIGAFTLSNTTINYVNAQNNQSHSLKNVNMTTTHPQLNTPFPIKGDFTYLNHKKNSTQINLDTLVNYNTKTSKISFENLDLRVKPTDMPELTVKGNAETDFSTLSVTISPLTLEVEDLILKGNLAGKNLGKSPELTGQVSSNTFNLRKILAANGKPLNLKNKNALTQVQLTSEIAITAQKITLHKLSGTIDGQAINGEFNYILSPNPRMKFTLQTNHLSVEDYIPSVDAADKKSTSTSLPNKNSSGSALVLEGNINAKKLSYDAYSLDNVKTTLQYSAEKLSLNNFSAGVFTGTTAGNIQVDFSGHSPTFAIHQKVSRVRTEEILRTLLGSAKMSGIANLAINVNASGSSSAAIKESLSGTVSFSVNNGVISGTDIDYKIDQAIAKYTTRAAMLSDRGQTPFTQLTGTSKFSSGTVANPNLELVTASVRVKASGTTNLMDNNINYELTCRLLKPQKINADYLGVKINTDLSNYDIPAKVGCTLQSPCVGVEMVGTMKLLAQEAAKTAAKTVVKKELLKHVDENVGKVIDQLFSQ